MTKKEFQKKVATIQKKLKENPAYLNSDEHEKDCDETRPYLEGIKSDYAQEIITKALQAVEAELQHIQESHEITKVEFIVIPGWFYDPLAQFATITLKLICIPTKENNENTMEKI